MISSTIYVWPSRWVIFYVNYVLGLLRCVNMGNVADVSEVHYASIVTVEMRKLVNFAVCTESCFERQRGKGVRV
jgi:hypothetical protein